MELPVIRIAGEERWDCQACGICCRGSIVLLSETDLQRIRDQRWEDDPVQAGQAYLERDARASGKFRLKQRPDGCCVFLTEAGRCRIHEKFGFEAKPHVCQMFPLQLIPREKHALLTLRRACPSAAADEGRTLTEHLPEVQRLMKEGELKIALPDRETTAQPAWKQANRVMAAGARIFGDARFPPVRRVVHALLFARLLDRARLTKLDDAKTGELISMLESSVIGEANPHFADRKPPSALGGLLFRLTVAEYIRLHPDYRPPTGFLPATTCSVQSPECSAVEARLRPSIRHFRNQLLPTSTNRWVICNRRFSGPRSNGHSNATSPLRPLRINMLLPAAAVGQCCRVSGLSL